MKIKTATKRILVTGSSGFIGSALVRKLKNEGHYVIGVDVEEPQYERPNLFYRYDLRKQLMCVDIFENNEHIDEVYNLACLMGGMGYIGDTKHSYDIMVGSSQIVSNIIQCCVKYKVDKTFYSSSACAYNMSRQEALDAEPLKEESAYPILCDLIYGYQKIFSEQMYEAAAVSHGLNIRIARFFNIFGPEGIWTGGKEKAPSAMARKVAMAKDGDEIEVWGTGSQQRSFLYITECLSGIEKLMNSEYKKPVNIGSNELVTINELAQMVIDISGKKLSIKNVPGIVGVNSRNTDNTLIRKELGWEPDFPLRKGMELTYAWVNEQVKNQRTDKVISSQNMDAKCLV